MVGKDKGKTGKVIKAFPEERKIVVENLNAFKKHVRPKKEGDKGEIVTVFRPIKISNIALVCSSCGKATRIGYKIEDKKKKRICAKCKKII